MASHSRFSHSVLYAVNRLPNYYANTGSPSRKDGLPQLIEVARVLTSLEDTLT